MADESRHGQYAPGWTKQGLTIPVGLRKMLAAEANRHASTPVKLIGTAALSLYLGMPEYARTNFVMAIHRATFDKRLEDITPEQFFEMFMEAVSSSEGSSEPEWEVVRILDPELTPPPGEKQSDRKQSNRRRKSG
jgi:hypothetical protein